VDSGLGIARHADRQDGEEHRPPDGQVEGDVGGDAHQCAPLGVSISSTRTPPMFFGWTKITGTPCAPIRGLPSFSTVAPLAIMSSTSKQTWCWPPFGFFSRKPRTGDFSPHGSRSSIWLFGRLTKQTFTP